MRSDGTDDRGRCDHCNGRVAATHMLTKTYPLDSAGCWQRRFADFIEDLVLVCIECGAEPEGTFDGDGTSFAFVPARVHRSKAGGYQ